MSKRFQIFVNYQFNIFSTYTGNLKKEGKERNTVKVKKKKIMKTQILHEYIYLEKKKLKPVLCWNNEDVM